LVTSIDDTAEYIDVEGVHAPEIGELVTSIDDTAEYIGVEWALRPGNRRIVYFHR
jgi:hypothetical protein